MYGSKVFDVVVGGIWDRLPERRKVVLLLYVSWE